MEINVVLLNLLDFLSYQKQIDILIQLKFEIQLELRINFKNLKIIKKKKKLKAKKVYKVALVIEISKKPKKDKGYKILTSNCSKGDKHIFLYFQN